ncbi:5-methyltetrahydrofolate--homocysteine methyltransferase [Marinagarivorans cellulosilyticus]|uniref:5-methyltetrahydrofolate--homocysteine methyltransferase n=1 Tax=Marinagarivorans cellulosilyticus TaxID=2721545 RepID=A0AAN1WJK4_9GAMM|nr:5-methyltetrahydrofolate--homocysteine methyltransferase [Marinagarivorans cellulosilyticus]BCD98750.1 hypothetical protein MARGE09_P2951 [Marinagarivorans cellulosilyticus]
MPPFFIKQLALSLTASAVIMALTGCGDANTTINEKASITANDDHDEHEHEGHDNHNHGGESEGRLLIINSDDSEADIYDLADGDLITTLALDAVPSAVYASAGYRLAALIERNNDKVGFIDGGLWQVAHNDHFDLITTMPSLSNFSLTGSRPTHFVPHEGQVALFLDGNTDTGSNASIQVFDDHVIEGLEAPLTIALTMPQHGVAEPRGEHVLASLRRDDTVSSSNNFNLPDQVGVYHLHDGEYILEQTLDVNCPDLHGAAQNENHIVFGCSDGVLLVTDNGNDTYSAQKLLNTEDVADGLRIGSLWGNPESGQFIAKASAHSGSTAQFFMIDPTEMEMELIDWQPMPGAQSVASQFSFEAEHFVILDDQGYLTTIEPHLDGDHTHWEYGERLDITDADVSTLSEGMKFSMTLAQNEHTVYIADPLEQHVRIIDLELLQVVSDLELDYIPAMITWLGIGESHDH